MGFLLCPYLAVFKNFQKKCQKQFFNPITVVVCKNYRHMKILICVDVIVSIYLFLFLFFFFVLFFFLVLSK